MMIFIIWLIAVLLQPHRLQALLPPLLALAILHTLLPTSLASSTALAASEISLAATDNPFQSSAALAASFSAALAASKISLFASEISLAASYSLLQAVSTVLPVLLATGHLTISTTSGTIISYLLLSDWLIVAFSLPPHQVLLTFDNLHLHPATWPRQPLLHNCLIPLVAPFTVHLPGRNSAIHLPGPLCHLFYCMNMMTKPVTDRGAMTSKPQIVNHCRCSATNHIPSILPLSEALLQKAIHESGMPAAYFFEIPKTVTQIVTLQARHIVLQLLKGLLIFAMVLANVLQCLSQTLHARYQKQAANTQEETTTKGFQQIPILEDASYGASCIGDLDAQTLGLDLLVHYGNSCLIPLQHTVVPFLYVFVEIEINVPHMIQFLHAASEQQPQSLTFIYVLRTIQFQHALTMELLIQQLVYRVYIPQVKPLSSILGCTFPKLNLHHDVDTCRAVCCFVANGQFHLESTMMSNPHIDTYFQYNLHGNTLPKESYTHEVMKSIHRNAVMWICKHQTSSSFSLESNKPHAFNRHLQCHPPIQPLLLVVPLPPIRIRLPYRFDPSIFASSLLLCQIPSRSNKSNSDSANADCTSMAIRSFRLRLLVSDQSHIPSDPLMNLQYHLDFPFVRMQFHSHPPSSSLSLMPSGHLSSVPTTLPSSWSSFITSDYPNTTTSDITSILPSISCSGLPDIDPSSLASIMPSGMPSAKPSRTPSIAPSTTHNSKPSGHPRDFSCTSLNEEHSSLLSVCSSAASSSIPSIVPITLPSALLSVSPSSIPIKTLSLSPSSFPSVSPSKEPSSIPSGTPSNKPSAVPTLVPSSSPSFLPSGEPSSAPLVVLLCKPFSVPSVKPSQIPSFHPSLHPNHNPSSVPSSNPSLMPSGSAIIVTSALPSLIPSHSVSSFLPSILTTSQPSFFLTLGSRATKPPSDGPSLLPSVILHSISSSTPSLDLSSFPSKAQSGNPSFLPSPSWPAIFEAIRLPSFSPIGTDLPTDLYTEWCTDRPRFTPGVALPPRDTCSKALFGFSSLSCWPHHLD